MAKLVSINPLQISINQANKPFSPRLVNYIEPIDVSGLTKTGIYTEVDSNLKVGDRVFLINGNYDSDLLVKSNKYKSGRDGYKIISIDKCRITLDIDYTGILPWNDDSIDSFIRIYPVRDNSEFIYVNKMLTSENGIFDNRFNADNDNIIYADQNYYGFVGLGENTGLIGSPGFFIKGGTGSWIDVTSDLLSNSPTASYLSGSSNDRIKIMNASFTYGGKEYKEGFVYKYENGEWVVDVTYFRTFISKSNFRDGNFKGIWNAGLFGRQDKKITWEGVGSYWNNGSFLNSIWATGSVNSSFKSNTSYFADIDEFGLPYQKVNISNNRGFGYSYFVDANMSNAKIINGNFYNTLLGTQSATFSVVEGYISSLTQSLNINILGGEYNTCTFESVDIKASEIKNSRLNNSNIIRSKSVNSHIVDSLFYGSKFNSENIMNIISYDKWIVDQFNDGNQYVIFKFYISDSSYKRLKHNDQFYINGVYDDSGNLLNFFDKKFKLTNYKEHFDAVPGPVLFTNDVELSVILSSSKENEYKLSGTSSTSLNIIPGMTSVLPSIDIYINIYQLRENSNFFISSDSYIVDSDFRSGLFDKSDWNSGNYISNNYDNVIPNTTSLGGVYDMSITTLGDNKLSVKMRSPVGTTDNNIKVGSIVYLNSIDYIDVISGTVSLPDTYRVLSLNPSTRDMVLDEIYATYSIIAGLGSLTSSVFTTLLDNTSIGNRYTYLHSTKINNSNIKSGLFRRSYIKNSVIYNAGYNNRDMDFTNLPAVKSLLIGETIFRRNGNTINSGVIINSFLTSGNDIWNDGIFYNSSWIGQTFSNGIFRESRWENGIFQNGTFYKSNNEVDSLAPTYTNEKIKTIWRAGNINYSPLGNFNNRYSWINGTFNNGEFYKGKWENGTFNNGVFYSSDWYNGTFSNGTLGKLSVSSNNTNFYNGLFDNGVVENASVYSKNTDYVDPFSPGPTSPKLITWNNGVFKSGRFGSTVYNADGYGEFSEAIWNDGNFNGGTFDTNGRWKKGTFNGGKFLSTYGCTMSSSTYSTYYSWEDGVFNGGEFGNANGVTNSTWYTGEFNGGTFKGRVWNNGVLVSGNFEGSSTYSAISLLGTTCSNPSNFVDSFTNSYYGLWRNGTVTDVKDKFIKDKKIFTEVQRAFTEKKIAKRANIKNALWVTGTFSHPSGEMVNCVWMDGKFGAGTFKSSSFNPYVKRNGSTHSSFNLNDSCYWENGSLSSSDFYISKWNDGKFLLGTAVGMIWQNGVANYMNAFNVFWENGTWRNGNWYGSSFQLSGDGSVTDDYTRQIIFRGMSWSGTSSCHVWNIFKDDFVESPLLVNAIASVPNATASEYPPFIMGGSGDFSSSMPSDSFYSDSYMGLS